MARVRKMYDSREDDWVYRLARPTKAKIRRRFAYKRRQQRERLAYTVPRQGRRVPRTKIQAQLEYNLARERLAYRNVRRHASLARTRTNARPLKKKRRSLWSWLWGR